MEVTREVVLDLIPAYLSGEASAATRALVEEYIARDPELAERVRAGSAEVLGRPAPAPPPDLELRSVSRTRQILFRMRWLFGLACASTAVGLSVKLTFSTGHLTGIGLVLFDYPVALGTSLALGAICWVAYFRLRRRLKITAR